MSNKVLFLGILDDMVYIHVFGKQNIATYYVNKKEVLVNEVIM